MRGPTDLRSAALEALLTAALGIVVVGVALVFARPWLPGPILGGADLDRYLPLRDGTSGLFAKYDAAGEVESWTSHNRVLTPWLGLAGAIRQAPTAHLTRLYSADDDPEVPLTERLRRNAAEAQIVAARQRTLDRAGGVEETVYVSVREARGELLVALSVPSAGVDLLYDPPAMLLPANLEPGTSWASEGRAGTLTYRLEGRVTEAGARETPLGLYDDCLSVESSLTLSRGQHAVEQVRRLNWFCAEVGLVASDEVDVMTGAASRSVLIGREGLAALEGAPPAPELLATRPGAPVAPESWSLTRVGRSRTAVDAGESTIPPLWVPTDPPLLLVAGYDGDLLALDAGDDLGAVRWRFHSASTIYGPPAFDPRSGRIFFGAGDRRLYALDVRGLFCWSFETGDNVAARPLIVEPPDGETLDRRGPDGGPAGSLVVFGGEDGTAYALDAATGAVRWQTDLGSPVASSPARLEDVVIFGTDDGTVDGLDVATGERRWRFTAGGAVEAPLVVGDGLVYVASRDGTLAAFDPSDCEATCDAIWEAQAGRTLRTAPAVADDRAFVVDDEGFLLAFDADEGDWLWSRPEREFVGPPVVVGETLIVARKDGRVTRLGVDGAPQGSWSPADALGPVDPAPQLALGPAVGGGALWLADDGSVIRRLGPDAPGADVASIRSTWTVSAFAPPLTGSLLVFSPVEHQGMLVVLDAGRHVIQVDPDTGQAISRGLLGGDDFPWQVDPVVAGNVLLAQVGTRLQALDLVTGRALWSFDGGGAATRPPVVAGDTVIWQTSQLDAPTRGRGTVHALGLADGALRWQVPLDGLLDVGGAAVYGDVVYLSSPPSALDLATGGVRWRAEIGGPGSGGPTLEGAGATLFVGGVDSQSDTGVVAAVDTVTGRLRWRVDLGQEVLRVTERLWLDGGAVIVPVASGSIVALDAETGRERWRYRPRAPRLGNVTVERGLIWMVLDDSRVLALDVTTGRVAARFRDLNVSSNGQGLTQRPAIVGDVVAVAIGRMVLGLRLP